MKLGRCSIVFLTLNRQFFLLLWKNFILQIRRPIGTVFELILPILTVVFIVGLRLGAFSPTDIGFVTFKSDSLSIPTSLDYPSCTIYYAPNSPSEIYLMDTYIKPNFTSNQSVIGVATQDDFIASIRNSTFGCNLGIYFENINSSDIRYSLRFPDYYNWKTESVSDQFDIENGAVTQKEYSRSGFLFLEKIINEAIIKNLTNHSIDINVTMRQFPYPHYKSDSFLSAVSIILPLLIVLALLYSAGAFVKELVLEKETRMRETMKMMGLSNWILWTTWFFKQLIFYFVPLVIITILLKYGRVFPLSDGFLILIFFLIFMCSGISFCFFISVWFSSAQIGMLAGFLLWFVAYIPYFVMGLLYSRLNLGTKIATCILPGTCVGFGVRILSTVEQRQEGLTHSNFASPLSIDDSFNMGWVFLMLALDTVLYMLLYWYIDAVKPGKYGIPKPFYFFCLPSYWCGWRSNKITAEDEEEMLAVLKSSAHETEPVDLPIGISIEKLTKIFDKRSFNKKKIAVDQLSLKMYKGQITALLGQNGAGKTTTMSILTGLFPPTEGRAFINGLNVVSDIDLIRYSLGICPQHNVLFDRLTVQEHLSFFARLKGCSIKRVQSEVKSMIEDLHLTDKSSVRSEKLSGGMKRKLSVGIALVGGSEVVILDEPTSGMDPYARRATWDLLLKHKENRTILLTTHFMDEADLLGDRIAIMAEGQLRCSGSSLFLKSRYGVGYHLTIVKEPHCNVGNVASLVEGTVDGAQLKTNIGAELSFTLPTQSSHLFPQLFDSFNDKRDSLGISSFGISVTTMEEVFLRVATGNDESLTQNSSIPNQQEGAVNNKEEETILSRNDEDTAPLPPHNTGLILWIQQFAAMFLKRFYQSIRFWLAIIWQLIIPLLFVLCGLIVAKVVPGQVTTDSNTATSRVLSIGNSAPSRNVTIFGASFDSFRSLLSFEPSTSNVLGATNLFNRTNEVLNLQMNDFINATDPTDCCNYRYQILDKYCATRTADEIRTACNSNNNFGYKYNVQRCWSCCGVQTSGGNSCPVPPAVSIADFNNPFGPLDSVNTFVAEYLLRTSRQLGTYNFFLTFQAGYVVHSPEPTYSVCGCQNNETDTCSYMAYGLKSNPSPTSIDCPDTNLSVSLNCAQLNSSNWEYSYNEHREYCMTRSCDNGCSCTDDTSCQFGATSQPLPPPENPTVTVWYNNQPYHMAPAALNGFYNLYLKSKGYNFTISVTNNPLPSTLEDENNDSDNAGYGFMISILTIFGLSFLYSSFIVFPIQEKQSKAKHLQFVSGVNYSSYWIATFAWDLINAFIPAILIIILFAAFQVDGFKDENIAAIFILVLLSCWACIPLNYVMSLVFNSYLLGFCLMIIFYLFISLFMQVTLLFVSEPETAKALNYVFLIHPGYALVAGMNLMYTNQMNKKACLESSYCSDAGYINIFQFDYPGIGHIIVYMMLEGLIFCALTILIERRFFLPKLKQIANRDKINTREMIYFDAEDEDVAEERNKVNKMTQYSESEAVILKNLVKEYRDVSAALPCSKKPRKLAVNGINLAIPSGECFGLLGVNGAGKTTTFKMLTGDLSPTSGSALLSGYDISTQLNSVHQHIGYCPQFDALIERLTGRELLTMFARLRGIPERCIKDTVNSLIKQLDFTEHADKKCGSYSGGNKRKLSTAIALVGNPPILLLDEPTTGMDPATRRHLWNVLINVVKEGRSVVLTSHSMEECEALCTRLAIMVNGSFKCLGSVQHLKSKFGHGYTLQIRVNHQQANSQEITFSKDGMQIDEDEKQDEGITSIEQNNKNQLRDNEPTTLVDLYDTGRVEYFVTTTFPGSLLLGKHQGSVAYQVPSEGISWSKVFHAIEENKAALGIIDYSVCQTTIEQVFINFAQEQNADV